MNQTPTAAAASTRQYLLRDAVSTFRLSKDRIVIGSVASADVRLIGAGVSPIHAVIELGPESQIFDLASESGIVINGNRVISQKLKSGDEIGFGTRKLRFVIEESFVAAPVEDVSSLLLEDSRDVEEIFDWRPAARPALEVVMSWEGTILDVEHFTSDLGVTVGDSKRNDFSVPLFLGNNQFELVSRHGDDFMLNLTEGMKGVIQRTGRLQRIEDAKKGPVLFQQGDFAKVMVGSVDFYVSFTAAPPKLKRRRVFAPDPFFYKCLMGSAAFTAALLAAMLSVTIAPPADEPEPPRIATILYNPEMYAYKTPTRQAIEASEIKPVETTPPVKPDQVQADEKMPKSQTGKNATKNINAKGGKKSPGQNEAREGRGARAKGTEGTRGTLTGRPDTQKQNVARRPSPEGGKGAGGSRSQVNDQGNVDMLKGVSGKIQNLLSSSSQRLGKGGEKLQGFGGFNTQGNNGLALSGDGRGGGGDANTTLGGLSDRGKGGGRVGTGSGAAGSGNGFVGGQARPVIRSGGPEEAIVMGSIDRDAVEAALQRHRDEFRLCYEREINAYNPKLSGTVVPSFVIGASGRVTQAGIESSSLKNPNAERCVLAVIKRIDFPIPRGGGIVQVSYPFKFSAGSR